MLAECLSFLSTSIITAMYAIIPQQIPQGKRAEINEKILFAINSGKDMIPAESIYNCYTGIGGLHNLKQSDFASYHEYAEAKKEFEMGQFFTPHEVCRDMVDVLSPTSSEMILDMCCGMGNFFNHLPNQHNAYGFDIDSKAVAVARYLYPDAHIDKCDIQQYHSEQRFDAIIGNPPFNLKFDFRLSQEYYIDKAYHLLNPAGFLMIIVPASFMQNEFWEKSRVGRVNEDFSFIGQTRLAPHAFTSVGVDNFNTKIMVFLRRSQHIEMNPYNAEEFVSMAELKERVKKAREMKHRLRLDLMRETNRIDKEELEHFEYKLAKYMYELKAHEKLNKHIDKAVALVTKFRNQKPPDNATNEQMKEWERKKLTTAKVLATIRKYITSQNVVPRKEVALVKTSYGFKLKQYAPRLLDKVEHKAASINDLILDSTVLPMPEIATEENMRQIRIAKRLIRRKRWLYDIQNQPFSDMETDDALTEYLDNATFVNKDGEVCEFTQLQKHDLNLVLQKRYALLNWQQGSGKTAAVYHRAKYLLKYGKWKIQCKLPPKTKRFCPLKTFNNAPLKSLDRWGYYYFSLFPSVCSHFTDTFSCQLNPVRRMYNTIHNGICYCRVSDCIIPIVRWQLRGDDDGLAPMSVLYYIEQDGSFLGIKVHKEEVIQYEQRAPFDSLEFRFQCAFYFCHLKRTHKFRSIRIICPYALLAGFIPHCCGKEALPGTG